MLLKIFGLEGAFFREQFKERKTAVANQYLSRRHCNGLQAPLIARVTLEMTEEEELCFYRFLAWMEHVFNLKKEKLPLLINICQGHYVMDCQPP